MSGGKLVTYCQAGGVSLEERTQSTITQSRVSRLEFRLRLKPETPDSRPETYPGRERRGLLLRSQARE